MLLKLRLVFGIANAIYTVVLWILSLVYRKKPPSIPTIKDSLYTLSAVTLAKMIRRGELVALEVLPSKQRLTARTREDRFERLRYRVTVLEWHIQITSEKVVRAYIERIKEVNPYLNAVVEDRFESAVNEAKICDVQLNAGKIDAETLEKEKPLFGIPFTVKEACALKGLSNTGCTLARKGMKAVADGIAVESLRNAGAIPLCVTNMPEMCCNLDSTNLLYGRTCNPYDTRYTSGGSSGGEGALLGAGASLIGIGSDFGGSIRVPAHFNGIFGHKPSPGIISNEGHFPTCGDENFNKYLTLGPMTRYTEDLSLAMKILTSKCNRNLRLDEPVDLKQLKVYYRKSARKSFGLLSLSTEIEQCVLKAAKHFSQNGNHTEKLPIEMSDMFEIMVTSFFKMKSFPQLLIDSKDPKIWKNPTIEIGKALIGRSQHTMLPILFATLLETRFPFSEADISYYNQKGENIRQKLIDLLGENGVFIYPTFRIPATFPVMIPLEFANGVMHSAFVNVFGLPAVHVPMGFNREGLPIGVQVVAAPYQDRLCLAVAEEMENAFGGWTPPSISIRD